MALTLSGDGRDTEAVRLPAGLFLRRIDGQESPILTNVADKAKGPRDRSGIWLRAAMIALAILSVTAGVVSYQAQYKLIYSLKSVEVIAALQAGIPDVASLVFACLGIALALQGKRAIRARCLNAAAVATSVAMNALASSHGWKSVAVWTLSPIAYAVTSDTLIGVLRAYSVARQKALNTELEDDERTPLSVLGRLLLWTLRLLLAAPSTLSGFRAWVVEEAPVAPGRKAVSAPVAAQAIEARAAVPVPLLTWPPQAAGPSEPVSPRSQVRAGHTVPAARAPRTGTKTADLIRIAQERHGALASLPLESCSKIATVISAEIGMHGGSARSALLKAARAAQNGGKR